MAKGTKDLATLMELFAALDNAPTLIAECLARPVLADRLIRSWSSGNQGLEADGIPMRTSFDDGWDGLAIEAPSTPKSFADEGELRLPIFARTPADCTLDWSAPEGLAALPLARENHTAVWTGTEMLVWGGRRPYVTTYYENRGLRYSPATDSWAATSTGTGCPQARSHHTAVWTGTEMIVWGGLDDASLLESGGRYNPSTDSWVATSVGTNCPIAREYHTAVWTGTEMVVWGGGAPGGELNSGGRYSPGTDSWVATSTGANCPTKRYGHTAVWTGTEMIVWGGYGYSGGAIFWNSGGRYTPSTDSWEPTSTGTNCPTGRSHHTAIWTGTEMIVWGGLNQNLATYFNTGARYSPAGDSWTPTAAVTDCPSPRQYHSSVWTGSEMIIWGGTGDSGFNTGGRYSPATNSWVATTTAAGCPTAREFHSAVWTGTEMIVWGGNYFGPLDSGGRYSPIMNSWLPTGAVPYYPIPWGDRSSIWTGTEMIVWGGGASGVGSGERYMPAIDVWTPTSTGPNCPSERVGPTAVWTGQEMVVWGGYDITYCNTGGRYSPITDQWASTSVGAGCPTGRRWHTSVWTGSEMIVWGGAAPGDSLNSGGCYSPGTDSWVATSTGANCPAKRSNHTAVWTGTEMIVWGGYNFDSGNHFLDTGGRYSPAVDSWVATPIGGNCPTGREDHSAVWTGSEMIVWGGYWNYQYENTGGRYNPLADSWTATTLGGDCPTGRQDHTAVWTGVQMIVWGGYSGSNLNTGGVYTPSTDSWAPTSTGVHCPSARRYHTSVWTGSEMIVWGASEGGAILALQPTIYGPQVACASATLSTGFYGFYQWYLDSVPIAGATARTYLATSPGIYTVSVTDSAGCTKTSVGYVLNPVPAPTVAGAATGCSSPGLLLSTGSFTAYQWIKDAVDIGGATSQDYTATASGTYSVRVTNANGCQGTSPGIAVTVSPSPAPSVSGPVSICEGSPATLTTGAFTSYQWGMSLNALRLSGTTAALAAVEPPATANAPLDPLDPLSIGAYYYDVIAKPSYTLQSGDVLEYDLYIDPASPEAKSAVDLISASGPWTLRGSGATDQNGLFAHPAANLVAYAGGKWYHRTISIPASGFGKSLSGTGSGVFLALEGDVGGTYATYATNIKITRAGFTQLSIYDGGASFTFPGDAGYTISNGYSVIGESVSVGNAPIYGATLQSYAATLSATYSVMVTDANGCAGTSAGKALTVNAAPVPTITGNTTGCASVGVALSTGTFAAYQWLKDAADIVGATTFTYTVTASGSYSVRVTHANGCTRTSPAQFVTINANPTPTLLGATSGCSYPGVALQLASGVYSAYQWFRNGLPISGATTNTYTATQSGTYTLMVADSFGCQGTTPGKAVTITTSPAPTVSGPALPCVSGTLQTQVFTSYQWYRNGSVVAGATAQSYFAPAPGTYKVWVTTSNGCGAFSPDFVISANPTPLVSGPSTGCSSVVLTTTAFTTYQWTKGGVDIPGATAQNYTVLSNGTYAVRVTNTAGCSATSSGQAVTLQGAPVPTVSGPQFNTCPATSVMLTATAGFVSYRWNYNGVPISGSGARSQSYGARVSGNYTVTVVDGSGCEGTSSSYSVFIDFCASSEVSPPDAIFPARLAADGNSATGFYLYFQRIDTLMGYNVYEGTLGAAFAYDTAPLAACNVAVVDLATGEMRAEITPSAGNHYYLVTAYSATNEGPSGYDSTGVEIPAAYSTCGP